MMHLVLNSEENDPFVIRTELKLNERLNRKKSAGPNKLRGAFGKATRKVPPLHRF